MSASYFRFIYKHTSKNQKEKDNMTISTCFNAKPDGKEEAKINRAQILKSLSEFLE